MRKSTDVYMEPVIIERPNCIIRVYRPILTDEERERRMKRIHDAAAALLMAVMRNEQKKKSQKAASSELDIPETLP